MADDRSELERRIADLEVRLTHQEVALEELVRSGLAQQRSIEQLADTLQRVREFLHELATPGAGAPGDEPPPPHY